MLLRTVCNVHHSHLADNQSIQKGHDWQHSKNQVHDIALVERWQEMGDSDAVNVLAKSPDSPSAGDQKIQINRR